MTEPMIRPMTVDDSQMVAELTAELGYEMSVDATRRQIEATADAVLLVAVVDGVVVGWIQGVDRELLIYPRILEVGGLVVAPGQQGRGIGRALLDALVEWAEDHGHGRIFVSSNVAREGAHAFYEANGFTRRKTSHTFSREL